MKAYELEPSDGLFFKVGEEPIKLELRRGLAEVYGTEMLKEKTYTFPRNSKPAVFTYHGATIEMTGEPTKDYHIKCHYMKEYLRIHQYLEKKRDEAEQVYPIGPQENADGEPQKPDLSKTPICLVCEPEDGRNFSRSTVCRILLNYATRRGRAPIFVDLDPDQGHIGIPGSVGALSVESPIDIEAGFSLRSSMLMHFGHLTPSADSDGRSVHYYKVLIENMAKIVHSKLEQDKKSYHSGVIINTSSRSDTNYENLLVYACKAFKANVVLIMDDVVLEKDLRLQMPQEEVMVESIPKTVDVYKTRLAENVELRYSRIREYFYGTPYESYSPLTSEFKFATLKEFIYRVDNPIMLPDSLMPLGSKTNERQIKVSKYDECSASDLLHHILAVSHCRKDDQRFIDDPECVLRSNLMGFICITSLRNEGEVVSILTPQKLHLGHILLYSDVRYMDSLL